MATPTGFQELNGSLVDLITLYEPRTSGPTGTTGFISKTYNQDLGSIFYFNNNLNNIGLTGTTGDNCGYKLTNGTDIGTLFSAKGSVVSAPPVEVVNGNFNASTAGLILLDGQYITSDSGITPSFAWYTTAYTQNNHYLFIPTNNNLYTTVIIPNGLTNFICLQTTSMYVEGYFFSLGQTLNIYPGTYNLNFYAIGATGGNYNQSATTLVVYANDIIGTPSAPLDTAWSFYSYHFTILLDNTLTNIQFDINSSVSTVNTLCITGVNITPTGLLPSIPTGCVGLYACKWVNSLYTGPIFKIRNENTQNIQDFYMNSFGLAIGTGVNGTGTSLISWLNGAIAFVDSWYDQSGTGNVMTQTDIMKQPIFDTVSKSVYYNGTSYLFKSSNILNATGNVAHTVIINVSDISSQTIQTPFCIFNTSGTNNAIITGLMNNNTSIYGLYYDFNNNYITTNTGTTLPFGFLGSYKYNTTTRDLYYNNSVSPTTSQTISALNIPTGCSSYLGYNVGDTNKNFMGLMSNVYVFNTAISDSDRATMETTCNIGSISHKV